jgi:hypothetical protein
VSAGDIYESDSSSDESTVRTNRPILEIAIPRIALDRHDVEIDFQMSPVSHPSSNPSGDSNGISMERQRVFARGPPPITIMTEWRSFMNSNVPQAVYNHLQTSEKKEFMKIVSTMFMDLLEIKLNIEALD